MKRTLTALMLAFGLGSLFIATPASAQYNPAVADVPFPFVATGKTMPAGKYNVSQLSGNSPLFTLRSENGTVMTQLGSREQGNPTHPSLTFARAGSDWVLVKITPPDSQAAYSLGHNPVEKNTHLRMAAMVSIDLK